MRFLLSVFLIAGLSCRVAPVYGQTGDDRSSSSDRSSSDRSSSDRSLPTPFQHPSGSYLGLGVVDLDADHAQALNLDSEHGVQIVRVAEHSAAEKAGLLPGDVLLTYNGENILGAQHLGRLAAETPAGRHVRMTYWRDGKVHSIVAITEERRANLDRLGPEVEQMRELGERLNRMGMSMPIDVPVPVIAWRNRALGIVCETLDPQMAAYFGVKDGVLVRLVEKGSASEHAGIKPGDVLVSVGDRRLTNPRDVTSCMRDKRSSTSMLISLIRDHKAVKLSVIPAEYPQ